MRHRLTPTLVRAVPVGLTVAALLMTALDADARVGGGQGFSSGSRGGSSGGGGGGGGGELVWILIQLLIRYPAIGVPVLIVVILFVVMNQRQQQRHGTRHAHTTVEHQPWGEAVVRHQRPSKTGWLGLTAQDPGLSEPVFQDYVQLVFRRAYEALGARTWEPLAPFIDDSARKGIEKGNDGVRSVREVVVAASPVTSVKRTADHDAIEVAFSSSRVEVTAAGERRVYVEERWTFRRAKGARSLAPDDVLRLGCPSCGAAVQVDNLGRCTNCGTPITAGQLQWQADAVAVTLRRAVQAPEVSRVGGGEEPGYAARTVADPELPAALRAFQGRHPGFDAKGWEQRVHHVFLSLQTAWDADRWQDARPFTTDAAWNTLGFWMQAYRAGGLRNRLADVKIVKMQVVKVDVDAWYESITIRFWASCKDWTEEVDTGRIVGGNKNVDRWFSEYWTFLRAIGSGDTSGDPRTCPSCGAPLDRINAAGTCGYCDAVITTGKFDWVLSRIDQPEVYRG